jgi:hypothetical protein
MVATPDFIVTRQPQVSQVESALIHILEVVLLVLLGKGVIILEGR